MLCPVVGSRRRPARRHQGSRPGHTRRWLRLGPPIFLAGWCKHSASGLHETWPKVLTFNMMCLEGFAKANLANIVFLQQNLDNYYFR